MEVKQEPLECFQKNTVINRESTFSTEIKTEDVDVIENPLLSIKIKEESQTVPKEFFFDQNLCADSRADLNALDIPEVISDLTIIKQEVTVTENIVSKVEPLSTLLSEFCDTSTLKCDKDFIEEPCSSKQYEDFNGQSKNYGSKQKVKSYSHSFSQKGYQTPQRRHLTNLFWKRWLACKFCGHFYINKFEYFTHSFIHTVKIKTSHLLNSKTNKPSLKTYKYYHNLSETSYMYNKQTKSLINKHLITDQKENLTRHLKIHTIEKPFECEQCLKQFTQKPYLNLHLKTHNNKKPYKCKVCLKQFKQKYTLNTHLKTHTDQKPFKCESCSKQFTQKSYLNTHLKTHTDKKPYKCEICLKHFSQKSYVKDHSKMHVDEKPFKCEICLKQFKRKTDLNKHLRIHTGEKPFKCKICLKQFIQTHHLKEHIKIHSGAKQFQCEICLLQFTLKKNLQRHSRIHTGEKAYKCEICSKHFTRKLHLSYHLKIHTGEKPFKCEICLKQFVQKSRLNNHLKIHTAEKSFECQICSKQFLLERYLAKHLKTHTDKNQF